MSGWGLDQWGSGPWGQSYGVVEQPADHAWAAGTHVIRIKLTSIPRHADPRAIGDALNTASWSITKQGTSQFWTIIQVTMVDEYTYDLRVLQQLNDQFTTFVVAAVGLLKQDGNPYLLSLTCQGCLASAVSTIERRNAAYGFAVRDLNSNLR